MNLAHQRRRRLVGGLGAAVVFGWAAWAVYGPLWSQGAATHLVVRPAGADSMARVTRADVVFEAWLVARHAKTLPTRPHRLFDTEHCAPAENSLALGIPMITLGALAIPAWWATGDPILTYNSALLLLTLVGAFAMYVLVARWTRVPAAGIAAGLLYAFHPIRLTDITHPTVWDSTWTVFALLFADRWFARGRWRDAAGLVASTLLQVGASFYTLLAATFGTPPFLLWLLWRDRLRYVTWAQVLFVAGGVALGTGLLLGPYLSVETGHEAGFHRSLFYYVRPGHLKPGEWLFPGWILLALAALALGGRRDWMLRGIGGDPRWALLAGALLAGWFALGDTLDPLPNLHRLFAQVLPGLDSVRVVLRVWAGPHLLLCVLAGLGVAAAVRLARRGGPWLAHGAAALLVVACGVQVLGAPSLGLPRQYVWILEEIEIDRKELAFFEELERLGNRGPLLEIPLDQTEYNLWLGPERILMTIFHGRRTSACFGSYRVAGRDALQESVLALPDPEAVRAIREQGFTTLLLRHSGSRAAAYAVLGRLGKAAERGDAGIEHVLSTDTHTAFRFVPLAEGGDGDGDGDDDAPTGEP